MYLTYINGLGADYKGQKQYEFIFSKEDDVMEDDWYTIPSSGRSSPPEVRSVDLVGLLKNSNLELELVQDSDFFGVVDACDKIVALGWEPFDIDSEERPIRVSFHYGDTLVDVTTKLMTKGLRLINDEIQYKLRK